MEDKQRSERSRIAEQRAKRHMATVEDLTVEQNVTEWREVVKEQR